MSGLERLAESPMIQDDAPGTQADHQAQSPARLLRPWANAARVGFATLLIGAVHIPWRLVERGVLRRPLPRVEHYWLMRIFRLMGPRYPVIVEYPNPLAPSGPVIRLHLDLCENSQQWHFRLRQAYEVEWLRLLAAGMQAGAEAFIDVGAHVGAMALPIAQAFPRARIVAIEPLEATSKTLAANIASSRLDNITRHQAAITDQPGPVPLYLNPLNEGGGSLVEPAEYATGDVRQDAATYRQTHPQFNPQVMVATLSLDALIDRPSVVKIDVEGAELSVLRSGASVLSTGLVEVMCVEVRPDTLEGVVAWLDAHDFDAYRFGQWIPLHREPVALGHCANLLCLRRGTALHAQLDCAPLEQRGPRA